ncbi:MAG TPA: hypothetical protein VIY72_00775, partial [Acidimicrobiales bacterium]
VEIEITEMAVLGGPSNVEDTGTYLRLDDEDHAAYDLGDEIARDDAEREVRLDLLVARVWEASVCEPFWPEFMEQPQGDSDASCVAWNTASADIDLDAVPSNHHRWTSHTFETSLHTPTGAGNALPTGYGDPRHFHVEATARVHVIYR